MMQRGMKRGSDARPLSADPGSAACKLLSRRSRGAVWPSTRPCQGRERRFESGRDRQSPPRRAWRGGRARLKATVSKTVIGATLSWVRIPPSPPDYDLGEVLYALNKGDIADVDCGHADTTFSTNRALSA